MRALRLNRLLLRTRGVALVVTWVIARVVAPRVVAGVVAGVVARVVARVVASRVVRSFTFAAILLNPRGLSGPKLLRILGLMSITSLPIQER